MPTFESPQSNPRAKVFSPVTGANPAPAIGVAPAPAPRTATPKTRQDGAIKGDRSLFEIAPGWAIGADHLQWLLMRQKARKPYDRRPPWESVSYVATTKAVLWRCIGERGITPTPEGRARLDGLPATFRNFRAGE